MDYIQTGKYLDERETPSSQPESSVPSLDLPRISPTSSTPQPATDAHVPRGSTGQHGRKSWLRHAALAMAFLACANVAINAYQSWSDSRNFDLLADQRLQIQASLMAGILRKELVIANDMIRTVASRLDHDSVTDEEIRQITDAFQATLGDVQILVLDEKNRVQASSHSSVDASFVGLDELVKRTRLDPTGLHSLPLACPEGGELVLARGYRSRGGRYAATILLVVPLPLNIFHDTNFALGTAAMLRNGQNLVIARIPSNPLSPTGKRIDNIEESRPGPSPASHFSHSLVDGVDRLAITQKIALGANEEWDLRVGYAVNVYRDSWYKSLLLNVLGMAIQGILLVLGVVLFRREETLRKQLTAMSNSVCGLLANLPVPVALIRVDRDEIVYSNASMRKRFGPMASEGECVKLLFDDESDWDAAKHSNADEAVHMVVRGGSAHMLTRCSPYTVIGGGRPKANHVLATFVDVSVTHRKLQRLQVAADFDELTGLANRRCLAKAANDLMQGGNRTAAVLALDLDHFKKVNDTYGHSAGDRVLQFVALHLKALARSNDLPVRLGGEEFLVLLPGASLEQARLVAERIRITVQNNPVPLGPDANIPVTVSIGVAECRGDETDLAAAQERADIALYRAKENGRNRVEVNL